MEIVENRRKLQSILKKWNNTKIMYTFSSTPFYEDTINHQNMILTNHHDVQSLRYIARLIRKNI